MAEILVKPSSRQAAAAFVLLFLLGLGIAGPAVRYPMLYDDLHLIRAFSPAEMLGALHGTWDPDNIETPGLRPGTLLFNSARYAAFGENVIAQHLFQVALFALFLTLVLHIALALGLPWPWALTAAALTLAAKYNVPTLVWLSDGIHLVQGIAAAATVLLLFAAHDRRKAWLVVPAAGTWALGLLVREDTLAWLPVIAVLTWWRAGGGLRLAGRQILLAAYAALILVTAGVFVYRAAVVPQAQAPGLQANGLFINILVMPNLLGLRAFDALSAAAIAGWACLVGLLVLGTLLQWHRRPAPAAALWLGCALLACLSGLTLVRFNLLLVPILCFALSLCALLAELTAWRPRLRLPVVLLVLMLLGSEVVMSRISSESFDPSSTQAIAWDAPLIYGREASTAQIPPDRRADVAARLAALGVHDTTGEQALARDGGADRAPRGPRHPTADGRPFVPLLPALLVP